MKQEDFKEAMKEYLEKHYERVEFIKHPIINDVIDAVKINDKLFFLADAYYLYDMCKDFDKVIEKLEEALAESKKIAPAKISKDKIVMQIINKEKNKELLKNIPYKEFLDLAIIYKAYYEIDQNNGYFGFINNEDLKRLELSEEDLYLIAKENTQKYFPEMIIRATDFEHLFEKDIEDIPNDFMFFLTNRDLYYGAITIIYDKIKEIALKYNKNLYILPSSIHDLVVILDGMISPEILMSIHKNIQENSHKEDFLSDNIYYYDREKNEFSIIKTLDENEKMIMSKTAALIEKFKTEGIL